MRKLIAGLALTALVVACSEQATAPQARPPTLLADFTNNPEVGNPWVARYTLDNLWAAWNNPEATVRVYATTFPLSLAGLPWDDALCGPAGPEFGVAHLQEISHWDPTHTDYAARYIDNANANVWIVLVSRTTSGGPCNTRFPIASGWGTLKYNDNSATGSTKQDAWSFKADGHLMTPGGDPVTFSGHLACEYNTGAKVNFVCHPQINMH
jgi:hypothetical protein